MPKLLQTNMTHSENDRNTTVPHLHGTCTICARFFLVIGPGHQHVSSHSSVRHAVLLVFVDLTGPVDLKMHCRLAQSMSKCCQVCQGGSEEM